MKEFKGTPGPWIAEDDEWSNADHGIVTSKQRKDSSMLNICLVEGSGTESGYSSDFRYEQIHNLNLIAAAPELLEALIMMVETRPLTSTSIEVVNARAAIAKALGE